MKKIAAVTTATLVALLATATAAHAAAPGAFHSFLAGCPLPCC